MYVCVSVCACVFFLSFQICGLELTLLQVSMISADSMNLVNKALKEFKGSKRPYGGVQMIWCGDPFQLPAFESGTSGRIPQFFETEDFQTFFEVEKLDRIYRQTDLPFLDFLNSVRSGRWNARQWEDGCHANGWGQDVQKAIESEGEKAHLRILHICNTNAKVNMENKKLVKIESEVSKNPLVSIQHEPAGGSSARCMAADDDGADPYLQGTLELCVGAKVMILVNRLEECYANGTIGTVVSFASSSRNSRMPGSGSSQIESVEVTFPFLNDDGVVETKQVTIKRVQCRVDGERNKATQFPLTLAYCMTVYKSQGCEAPLVIVDLEGMGRSHGCLYTALSRVQKGRGLQLKNVDRLSSGAGALSVDENTNLLFGDTWKIGQRIRERNRLALKEREPCNFDRFFDLSSRMAHSRSLTRKGYELMKEMDAIKQVCGHTVAGFKGDQKKKSEHSERKKIPRSESAKRKRK